MSNAIDDARRAFEQNQQARMKEAHECRTYHERMAYNGEIENRRRAEEERRRVEEEQRRRRDGR